MKRALALITAAAMATPALAWGDREQGALVGIFGTLIYQHIQQENQRPRVVQQPPVIVQQAPVIVQQAPVIVEPTYSCPPGTRAFWRRGWVQNQYAQWIQVSYLECNS